MKIINIINLAQTNSNQNNNRFTRRRKSIQSRNWTFLFHTLHRFGFADAGNHWIKTPYTSPKATVATNRITSHSFTLHRGTRQGCPLSIFSFAIFIEPLAATIRQNNIIKGVDTTNHHHKISLYADDVLLYLQNPLPSLRGGCGSVDSAGRLAV